VNDDHIAIADFLVALAGEHNSKPIDRIANDINTSRR
jgi:hypothetical protein